MHSPIDKGLAMTTSRMNSSSFPHEATPEILLKEYTRNRSDWSKDFMTQCGYLRACIAGLPHGATRELHDFSVIGLKGVGKSQLIQEAWWRCDERGRQFMEFAPHALSQHALKETLLRLVKADVVLDHVDHDALAEIMSYRHKMAPRVRLIFTLLEPKALFSHHGIPSIYIPPLHQRLGDILPIARHHFPKLRRLRFSKDALTALYTHPWPGQVPELLSCMEALLLISWQQYSLQVDRPQINKALAICSAGGLQAWRWYSDLVDQIGYKQAQKLLDQSLFAHALNKNAGSLSKTAKQLKLPISTLQSRLLSLGKKKLRSQEKTLSFI